LTTTIQTEKTTEENITQEQREFAGDVEITALARTAKMPDYTS